MMMCTGSYFVLFGCDRAGQSTGAMEMLSSCALSYCRSGKCERAACRSVLTLCKWLLADWKDLTLQLKQVVKRSAAGTQPSLSPLGRNIAALLELPLEEQGVPRITNEITGTDTNRRWRNGCIVDPLNWNSVSIV